MSKSVLAIQCVHLRMCLCVRVFMLMFERVRVCQVCVNRDERHRVRAWPCIIHGADLAEESQGSPALL